MSKGRGTYACDARTFHLTVFFLGMSEFDIEP